MAISKRSKDVVLDKDLSVVWALVRIHPVGTGTGTHYKKEEIYTSLDPDLTQAEYDRMIAEGELNKDNLRIIPRRQYFGEGMYLP